MHVPTVAAAARPTLLPLFSLSVGRNDGQGSRLCSSAALPPRARHRLFGAVGGLLRPRFEKTRPDRRPGTRRNSRPDVPVGLKKKKKKTCGRLDCSRTRNPSPLMYRNHFHTTTMVNLMQIVRKKLRTHLMCPFFFFKPCRLS